jgi:hypothetical protein
MNLDDILAVSGESDLFKVFTNKQNGLVLQNMRTGMRKFYPSRRYNFMPLVTVAIYTEDDSLPLDKVFQRMVDMQSDFPTIPASAKDADLKAYFAEVIPEYDRDRVYPRDMKKIIQWFTFLSKQDVFKIEEEEE